MTVDVRSLLPRRSTVVLFVLMLLLWYPIYSDLADELGGLLEDLGVPLLILTFVGLCGVYGATAARGREDAGRLVFVVQVFLRTMLLGGLSSGAAALLS